MSGKGSKRRPQQISDDELAQRWAMAFGRKHMTTVYLVSDGNYSDYHELGIYTTKALAKKAKEAFNAYNDIREWELDEIPETPPGLLAWRVDMDRHGNLPSGLKTYTGSGVYRASVDGFEPGWRPCGSNGLVCFDVWARDGEHAIKIANEQRIGLLASGEWLEDWNEWLKRKYPK